MNTELENRQEDWYNAHMGMCGTCYFKRKGRCICESSEEYDNRVTDTDGCMEWIEK